MTGLPEITVIVPVYNVQSHVAACIASLRNQTWTDFQAIVVDDGSTDESPMRLRDAIGADPRFQIVQQENRGLSGARNTGLDRARGRYVAFLDSDDRYAPTFLSRLRDELEHSGADWAACAIRVVYPDGGSEVHSAIHGAADIAGHTAPRLWPFDDWRRVIRHYPSAWNKLYRRSLIDGLRYDEGTYFEDHAFYYRAAARTGALLHVPEPLYLHTRNRPGQITSEDSDRVFQQIDVLETLHGLIHDADKTGADEAFERISARLLFERSTALHDPDRRRAFATAAAAFMDRHGLVWNSDWDVVISAAWGIELQGECPFSIILRWTGDPAPLGDTLRALGKQSLRGFETLIVTDTDAAADHARSLAKAAGVLQVRCLTAPAGPEAAGLAAATGVLVTFLQAGDVLQPDALRWWSNVMLRRRADFGVSGYDTGADADGAQSGFHDISRVRPEPPEGKPWRLTGTEAMELQMQLAAMVFRRDFLTERGLGFGRRGYASWPLVLSAALESRTTVWLPQPWVRAGPRDNDPPRTATMVLADMDALAAGLPARARRKLPQGWQKRLLARAIAVKRVEIGADEAALHRFDDAARLAIRSRRLRWTDSDLDREMDADTRAMLLTPPAKRFASAPGTADNAPEPAADPIAGHEDERRMLVFQTSGPARFAFRAAFRDVPFANLSFFDQTRDHVLFHISFRADQGVAAINRRDADGWGNEDHHPVTLDPQGTDIDIAFADGHVCVRVDGRVLIRLTCATTRFNDLDQIVFLEFTGGLLPAGMDVDTRPPGAGLDAPLCVTRRMELRGRMPADTGARALKISGLDQPLTLRLSPDRQGYLEYAVVLPGRVWCGGRETLAIVLRDGAGVALAETDLTRAAMLDQMGQHLSSGDLRGDPFLTAQVAEHLKFSDALDTLDSTARLTLARAADANKLLDFLGDLPVPSPVAPDTDPIDTDPIDTDPIDPEAIDLSRVYAAIAQITPVLESPCNTAALRGALAEIDLPRAEARRFFLALVEPVCLLGEIRTLIDWADTAALGPFERAGDDWQNSAILPVLFAQGRTGELLEILDALRHSQGVWLVTPAVAWVAGESLRAPQLHPDARDAILRSFADFLHGHADEYWDRTPCRALIGAAVALIAAHPRLPAGIGAHIAGAVLRTYGLSRPFWQQVADGGLDHLPTGLAAARAAFAELESHVLTAGPSSDPDPVARALAWAQQSGCVEAPRIRREILGPAGIAVSGGRAPSPEDLVIGGTDALEAAIRYTAFPGTADPGDALADMCAEAMPWFYHTVTRAPMSGLRQKTVAAAAGMLADGDPAPLPELESNLAALFRPDAGQAGLAIALGLLAGAAGTPLAEPVFDMLQRLVPPADGATVATLPDDPAIHAALAALTTRPETAALADRVRALFPGYVPPAPLPRGPLAGSLLFDTLVVVYSCRANLDTRIPAMRDGWLGHLAALGIPYVIAVGDGDGTLDGDVLYLDAPDDYEGLPQKTLAAIAWVHDHTGFAHMVKVDDDCFLNVPAYFCGYSYRSADYYGRPLSRAVGQTDRAWHTAKSATDRGRLELDKSPEPSGYADGGSGYALSRRAMSAALRAAASPVGQHLLQVSFMEDKLLGDLLSLDGIAVENTDYRVSIRRRMSPGGIPVSRWVNSFDPSRAAPVQLVHMDTATGQPEAIANLDRTTLTPKKIWASFQPVKLGYQTGTLEMVSPQDRLDRARQAPVSVVSCMRNEMFMLPHFLRHYREMGIDSFLIADNCSDDGTLEFLAEQPDVALFSVDTDYRLSHYGVGWQQALMSNFRVNQWSLIADADEFLTWQVPRREALSDLLARPDFADAEAVRIFMLDMYPSGPLAGADFASGDLFGETGYVDRTPFRTDWPGRGPYSNARTWTSALRHRLLPGSRPDLFVAQKLALLRYRPWMRFSAGLHYACDMAVAQRELIFAHFKYNADFHRKAQAEVARRQHFNDAEEYRKYLNLLSEGRDTVFDPAVSIPWTDSRFVRDRLDLL